MFDWEMTEELVVDGLQTIMNNKVKNSITDKVILAKIPVLPFTFYSLYFLENKPGPECVQDVVLKPANGFF